MSSKNAPAGPSESPLAARKYGVRFIDQQGGEQVVEVDPERIPHDTHAQPGSLLEIALGQGVDIDHACGGVCACATCHVIVREGYDACNQPTDAEEDRLDDAYGLTTNSRLACQCVPTGERDLVVEIPTWNRNLAREGR